MSNTNSVVAVFESHDQAEDAIRELQKDGFDMKKLSIVGKDYHTEEHVVGYYTTGDRMLYWGKLGAFWGGFWGLLFGSAFFWVPGVGQLLVAGPLVMWIVGALEEAAVVGGLSALGAGLYSIGIPKNSVVQYETEVKNGKLLLVAHGTADEVERARELLHQTRREDQRSVHAELAAVARVTSRNPMKEGNHVHEKTRTAHGSHEPCGSSEPGGSYAPHRERGRAVRKARSGRSDRQRRRAIPVDSDPRLWPVGTSRETGR